MCAARTGARDQLVGQPALADPGLTDQRDQTPLPREHRLERIGELSQLAVASNKDALRRVRARVAANRTVRRRAAATGAVEHAVLRQDRLLEVPQPAARVDPKLLAERPPRVLIGLESIRLASAAVQREHELRAQPLTQGVVRDQSLKLGRHARFVPERQVRVDTILDRGELKLSQP